MIMNCALWQLRYSNTTNKNNNNNNAIKSRSSNTTFPLLLLLWKQSSKSIAISITLAVLLVATITTNLETLLQRTPLTTTTTTASLLSASTTTTRGAVVVNILSNRRYYFVSAWISQPSHFNNHSNLWWNRHSRSTIYRSTGGTTGTSSSAFVSKNHQKRIMTTSTTGTTTTNNKMTNTAEDASATTNLVDTLDSSSNNIQQKLTFRESVQRRLVNTWIQQLDTETEENYHKSLLESRISLSNNNKNQTKRQVYNGHYVIVAPTPLPNPRLLLYSTDVAEQLLGFTSEQIHENDDNDKNNNDFIRFVAGHSIDVPSTTIPSGWATPYALSIMGTRYTNNCPFGTGNAYGDGRAISIAEISTTTNTTTSNENDGTTTSSSESSSYELQLKGGGTTPFHRGADGRAVLRSSIREFLASEAMHYLHVPTTRALSLVVSTTATIQRPWYKDQIDNTASTFNTNERSRSQSRIPKMDDPRLAEYTIEQRKQIINQIRRQNKEDPDILISEPCAITCRVSPSFVRIGHIDLFARRAVKASLSTSTYNTDSLAWKELEKMIWHACYREYRADAYTPYIDQNDIAAAATAFLEQSAHRLANMVSQWIRVGFAQGNFNADNCLVGGYTMDYGPFGFMEEYDPLFAKWTGSGQHFGFMNQPSAAFANYGVLVESIVPVIAAAKGQTEHETIQNEFLEKAQEVFQNKVDEVFRIKLGFIHDHDAADDVWEALEPLLRNSRVDYTLFFRELSYMVREMPNLFDDIESVSAETLLTRLIGNDSTRDGSSPFYEELTDEAHTKWLTWLQKWRSVLKSCYDDNVNVDDVAQRMLQLNPKYVLREWMLVEAYQKATNENDESELLTLYNLIQHPYEEGTKYETNKYYRRAPDDALIQGGTAFMS